MPERASASPTKEFFISMITRDIALEDCILDLLDNCIDGARATVAESGEKRARERFFDGFWAEISMSPDRFVIRDNCGGIPTSQARDYAFHFGRRKGAAEGAPESIGLYGIGMKRAMFKMGEKIDVRSSTKSESFLVPIDVSVWADEDREWDFDLLPGDPFEPAGTTIEIERLKQGVSGEFGDQVFVDMLRTIIARDYSLILRQGFQVVVNREPVPAFQFGWLVSEDIEPIRLEYDDNGVQVDIRAGMSRIPADEDAPGDPERPETRYFGWFVACNDRVVLAGNKDQRTVWGDDGFPGWHPQYNGFTGVVHFRSANPKRLPWTTTKRGVDETAPVYRNAVTRMKEATRQYISYTNARKSDLEEAKKREQAARLVDVPVIRAEMKVPTFTATAVPRVKVANIAYSVPEKEFFEVAEALGNKRMPKKEVGLRTFAFFQERMVGGE